MIQDLVFSEQHLHLNIEFGTCVYVFLCVNTVDREIFTLKIIRGLNFYVKNISSLNDSQRSAYTHFICSRVQFSSLYIRTKIL